MKKPPTAQAKLRRNFQKNPTKKTGVHPVPAKPLPEPHGKPQAKKMLGRRNPTKPTTTARGPYKLNEKLIRHFEESIEESAGAPIEMHLGIVGISRDTYGEWRKAAQADPASVYGEFVERIDKALHASWRKLHALAVHQKPFETLVRRYAEFYPSEAMQMQLSGADGLPLFPSEQQFNVVIELATPANEPEPEFRIVTPGNREVQPRPQSNGELPPHS
jgi:hypothetical protein